MAKTKAPGTPEDRGDAHARRGTRRNIPTAEYQSVVEEAQDPIRVAYERRNRDLDPQLVWRGKDEQDWSDLVVHAPPLYIQEKVHPKVLIDDLCASDEETAASKPARLRPTSSPTSTACPKGVDKTEFYQHDQNWSNRMILGDSLQVMASLAERGAARQGAVHLLRSAVRHQVQQQLPVVHDEPGREGRQAEHITREPEQVKAFRDTWRDGIHSYLTYLRDRLTVARDLLDRSGSIFVQIGDENVICSAVMDEIFGEKTS